LTFCSRFLAEMLDHVGLLSAGNEELARFAWKTFSKWQARRGGNEPADKKAEKELYEFMANFRETFSRPVRRIRFLGLFDTVNSVPRFENAWMQRSKFPYTARSSAKVIRHAVAIDERRAKFRQDLISGTKLSEEGHHHHFWGRAPAVGAAPGREVKKKQSQAEAFSTPPLQPQQPDVEDQVPDIRIEAASPTRESPTRPPPLSQDSYHSRLSLAQPVMAPSEEALGYSRAFSLAGPMMTRSLEELRGSPPSRRSQHEEPRRLSGEHKKQDIEEIWFPGCHADIGGGWPKRPDEMWPLSHAPLVWMVHEAQKAGLKFDAYKMAKLNCCPDAIDEYGNEDEDKKEHFHNAIYESGCRGLIHDCLEFDGGLPLTSVLSWKAMEYLPFRRMDLRPDGSWKPIRWPLPAGETRDIPEDAKIHRSAIKRMDEDETYRPGNLIIGGGGRGVKIAPLCFAKGYWKVASDEGDPIRETYMRLHPIHGKA
jgi:Uncharacterized alpha/beta hydrolase domain (DUF2235)